MKRFIGIKVILLLVLMTGAIGMTAQTVTLKFTGRDVGNQYVRLNRVVINNLTKNWQETIWWPDTVLTMQNGTGIDDYTENGGFALSQNNPNPFSGTTDVTLMVTEEGTVTLQIADVNGRTIVETQNFASLQPGDHQFRISISSVGTYVMTARQNGKTSSIKMICNGGSGTNTIDYLGEVQSLTYMLKSTTNKPFNYGDMMEYIGYATVNGTEVESQRITQAQGSSQTFTLQFAVSQAQTPTVTTSTVTNFSATTAICGGNVTSDGGATVTERGVCWSSTSTNPTINGNHQAANGGGSGSFNLNVTGLSPNTTYYVKAYATNSVGTGYGEQLTFTTLCNTVNVNITGNTTINYGGSTTLTASGANTYHWSNGANTAGITVSPTTTTTYTVTGTDNNGCTGIASVTVIVNNPPTVTTNSVTTFTATTAICGGTVTSNGTIITERGICWSSSTTNPTLNDSHKAYGSGSGAFSFDISGLAANTTYYVKAYATYSGETVYGTMKSFTTSSFTCGTSTTDYDGNSYNTVQIGQQCWMAENLKTTHLNNGVSIPLVQDSTSWGNSSSAAYCYYNLSSYGCLYNYYAVDGNQLCPSGWHVPAYDEVFTELYNSLEGASVGGKMKTTGTTYWLSPNEGATNSSGFSARGGGYRWTSNSEANYLNVKEYGLFWISTTYDGTYAYDYDLEYNESSLFRRGYSFVDYAFDKRYGLSVRCLRGDIPPVTTPTVVTYSVTNTSSDTATCVGYITSMGNTVITAKGVCWSTSPNPTISNNHTNDGGGMTSFTSSITGLSANTTYYVRAYATNSAGTAYGEQRSLTITGTVSPPPCNVSDQCGYTFYLTDSYGDGWNNGSLAVVQNGVTVANITLTDGSSGTETVMLCDNQSTSLVWIPGSYVGEVGFSLEDNSGNVVCSYSAGSMSSYTTYTFTAGCQGTANLPTVITNTVTNITTTSATCGGNVMTTGGASVTARGVCFSTLQNPTVNSSHTSDGSGTGSFTSSITGLASNTTYYVRAYATNSAGTSYGEQKSFTTASPIIDGQPCPNAPTMTDYEGHSYPTVQIGNQCWMAKNLRTTHYSNGASIPAGGTEWSDTDPFYYNYTSSNINITERGYLYNWPAVMHGASSSNTYPSGVQGICPTGWHVPSAAEWELLTDYVSDQNQYWCNNNNTYTAKALAATTGWDTYSGTCCVGNNQSANNATGFAAVPAGKHYYSTFDNAGEYAFFWSATQYGGAYAYDSRLIYTSDNTMHFTTNNFKDFGYSVRCLRDPLVTTPTVTTNTVSNIGTTSATCGGNVTSDGGATVAARGVCWSTSQNPTVSGSHTTNGSGTGSFTSYITGLAANTTYYVRAYATNIAGTVYGEQRIFTTPVGALPTVTTNTVSNVTTSTATCGGNVSSAGGTNVTARGVCWSTSQNPTTSNSHTTNGSGTGGFTSSITGLTANTTYYVRAYATNSAGTAYGTQRTFTTTAGTCTVPTVTTNTVSNTGTTSATCGGNVTSDGGATVTARGVCWSTSQNPTTSSSHTTNGSGIGSFTSSITGLTANTTYYVRAYATNSAGTAYGTQRTFTTEAGSGTPPTVTTNTVSNVSTTTATCGGNVTNSGSTSVTARGVCWSTSQSPTVSGSHTTNGSGTGSFTSSITGLTANTTYYVRAYATNSVGTAYGTQRTFTTEAGSGTPPTVTTNTVSNVSTTTATCGGNVTNSGSTSVTARGVCWSTSQSPTVSGSHTTNGSGTGSFTSSITGLTANTTYYVRAYATNSVGTAYGTQRTFTTSAGAEPTVTTSTVSNISTTSATCGGNVTSAGGTSVTARGVCWSTSQNPTVSGSHTTNGSGTGSFTSNITGLTANTTYYVRAYATNSAGTAYGTQRTFTTNAGDPPTVTTNTVSDVGITTATCGGNVTNSGGTSVTARGVCWSTSQNPTVSGNHTTNGSGTGYFTSNITGLTAATTYYVRAYATNSGGTSYGTQRSFTTSGGIPCPPTLSVSGTVSQMLHWTDNNGTGCGTPTSFQVLQRIPCTNSYAQIATTTSHYYTNYDVHPGINRYKVVAVNNAGSEESAVASSSSVPLSSPGILWVDDLGGNCLQFTWSAVDWASRYEIQYSTNGSSYHSDITINNGSQTTTTKCYPQFSGIVYFRIRAVFDDCSSIDDPVYSSWSAAQSHWF